jgi:hypothetical protein
MTPLGETTAVGLHGDDADGRVISASFTSLRQALTGAALLPMLLHNGC